MAFVSKCVAIELRHVLPPGYKRIRAAFSSNAVLTVLPANNNPPLTLNCSSNKTVDAPSPWMFDPPTPSGGCCSNYTIQLISSNIVGASSCPKIWQGVWLVQDCCTNSLTCTQLVTVVDTTPPVLTCPPNKTVECNSPLTFDPPTAYDACCPSHNLTYWFLGSNIVSSSGCQTVWAGRWQVSDCCSNFSSICTQLVTVADTTPPVFTNCPASRTVACGTSWDFGPTPGAYDTCCGSNVMVTVAGTVSNISQCLSTYMRIWQATDCCNNSATCTQTVAVTVMPVSPPVLTINAFDGGTLGWDGRTDPDP